MYRKIIIAAIIIVLAILVCMVAFTSGTAKDDTVINFLTNSTLKNGDSVKFQLTDSNGNPLANQEIVITLSYNGKVENYSIITDSDGTGSLVLNELDSGDYKVSLAYNGDDKYNPSTASQKLTVEEETYYEPVEDYSYQQDYSYQSSYDSSSSSENSQDPFDYNGAPSITEPTNTRTSG